MVSASPRLTQKAFELLEGLKQNNTREWFEEHREEFRDQVQDPFAAILEAVSDRLAGENPALSGSRKTMFRLHRDVRFSKDKTPYSTHVSGVLTPSGTKNEGGGLVYLHCDTTGGMMAAGFYKLSASDLEPIRQRIIDKPAAFRAALKDIEKAGLALQRENSLTKMPRGFEDHKDHEFADELKLKSLVVMKELPKSAWTKGDVVERAESLARASLALIRFGGAA
ncbi:MAG: DUF2461 domain-containing protein [Pseudomonadota bacterium]